MADAAQRTDLRALLDGGGLLHLPLIFDPVSARVAGDVGFDAVLVGGGMTAMHGYGLPDGDVEVGEVIEQARRVRSTCEVPLMVDIDDAGGSPSLVHRHVRAAEAIGAGALLIEDVDCVNRHRWDEDAGRWTFEQSRLRPREAATELIRVAVAARRDPRTVVVARTDALVTGTMDDAVARAEAFAGAGADVVFLYQLPPEAVPDVAAEVGVPIMNLVPGPITGEELGALRASGLRMAVHTRAIGDVYGLMRQAMADVGEVISAGRGDRVHRTPPPTLKEAVSKWSPGDGLVGGEGR